MAQAAIESTGKNPDLSGTFLVLSVLGIALIESAVIYALIVAFKVIGMDPATITNIYAPIAAGIAIGCAGLGAGVGEGLLVSGAMEAILRDPAMKGRIMTYMVLFVALVESVAIYGLIIALRLLG
jgi:F-type H+-transporting ATPase subunit c